MPTRDASNQAPSSKQYVKSELRVPVEKGLDGLSISQKKVIPHLSKPTTASLQLTYFSDSLHPTTETAEPEPDLDWDPEEVKDEEAEIQKEIERRRAARQAAYQRGIGAVTPSIQAVQASDLASSTPGSTRFNTPGPQKTDVSTPQSNHVSTPTLSPSRLLDPMSPAAFDFANEQGLAKSDGEKIANEDGPSAADYDPTADMEEDERRDEMRHGNVGLHGELRQPDQAQEPEEVDTQPETTKKSDEADDDDDDFDMFAEEFDEAKFAAAAPKPVAINEAGQARTNGGAVGIVEGDDKDGYYKIRLGDVMDGRYQIKQTLGRGMFSGVARAYDVKSDKEVAIKVMRKNDALRKGGLREIAILEKLNREDPGDKKHIVRYERSFEYKGHLCMVFESLSLNLREVIKKFGNNVGINLGSVRLYAYQIFIGLAHMRKQHIIHADLKPDNILVSYVNSTT